MFLEFSDEQEELRASVRAVLERECPPSLVRAVVERGEEPAALWRRMVELDWPALTVPEDCGGLGLGFVELAVVAEELGRVIAPGPFSPTVMQFLPAVRETATDDQRRWLLGAVARGELTGTLAVAEEAGSWDPVDVQTTARPDGDGWVLEGAKHFVLEGGTVDEVAVAARLPGTAGTDGLALFVVPSAVVAAEPLRSVDASRHYSTLTLAGVRVGPERALGRVGEAGPGLQRALEEATVALALETLGTCQSIFDRTLAYAKEREQFGRAIGSFQAVKHAFADMLVSLERARAACYFAAACIAEDDERRGVAVPLAKAAVGDCQRLVAQKGIQLHGGIGFTWEHDLHLFVKRAKAGDALLGTAATHRQRLAHLIGL